MKTKFHLSSASRITPLKLGAARIHARIAGRLNQASTHLATAHSLFSSPWSPIRLDLLKTPLTRSRE